MFALTRVAAAWSYLLLPPSHHHWLYVLVLLGSTLCPGRSQLENLCKLLHSRVNDKVIEWRQLWPVMFWGVLIKTLEINVYWYFLNDDFPYLLCVKATTIKLIGSRRHSETGRPCNLRGLNNWILGRSVCNYHYSQYLWKVHRHTEPHISRSFFWHLPDISVIMMDPMILWWS